MAVSLPTGTVTFLFTDIEGSTRLLQELGDRYRRVQDDHAAIIRKAIENENGVVIRTEGDSFFVVFPSAVQATRAVVAAQRGLAAHDWTHGAPLLVRMGMHSGEGVLGGDDYLGIDVNRAARIVAAAHGGQALVSAATRALVQEALPSDVGLLDLGEHRLKDFDRPIRLFQLTAPDLDKDFPPLRTLEVPTNLPTERTAFIGRERELAGLLELIRLRRLVTLTGPGGTGKTRLALRAAAKLLGDFSNGVYFIDLAPISDPGLVPSTIASTLRVREEAPRPIEDSLIDHLRPREVLLVLDNFEQILEAAPVVGTVLDGAPKVRTIVTSRAPLRITGEQEFPVPPLAVPQQTTLELDHVSRYEAVALFVDRARAVDPRFSLTSDNATAVAEICGRVDGLPLAIELAASRVRMLTPQAILGRLDQRLPLLRTEARDVPERQRTLRETIAWSYDLLTEPERTLFRRLAAFVGGWTLETFEAIVNPQRELELETLDGLESLSEKSLVQRVASDGEPRFGMLETIREYGLEQLAAAGESQKMRTRHATAFLELAERAEDLVRGRDSKFWLDGLEAEHDNFRAALRWTIETGHSEEGMRLGAALWRFWQIRDHLSEGRQWMEELLAQASATPPSIARAKALLAVGSLAYWQTDLETAERRYQESLDVARALGDRPGVAEATFNLAFPYAARGELEHAERFLHEARRTFEDLGDERQAAFATGALGMSRFMSGHDTPEDTERALTVIQEARERFRAIGDVLGVALMSGVYGMRSLHAGDLEAARAGLAASLDAYVQIEDMLGVALELDATAMMAGRVGRHDVALRLAGASSQLRETAKGGAPPPMVRLEDPRELARGTLSTEQIEAAYEAGHALSAEAAIELARKELAIEDDG